MSRKEEIIQYIAEKGYAPFSEEACLIIDAQKWCDETMIKRVCEYLEKNCIGWILTEDEIKDLCETLN